MNRRLAIAATAAATLAAGMLAATTATASATPVALVGNLVGPQLDGWTYYASYYTDDDATTHNVTVGPEGSYTLDIGDLSSDSSVYISYYAESPTDEVYAGFPYDNSYAGYKPGSVASYQQLDTQNYASIQGQIYDNAKGAAAGGLADKRVAVFSTPRLPNEDATTPRAFSRSTADGSYTVPMIYRDDTSANPEASRAVSSETTGETTFEVRAGDYDDTYLPTQYDGPDGTDIPAPYYPWEAITGIDIGLLKGGVLKGRIVLPRGATDTDRSVALWSGGKWLRDTQADKAGNYSFDRLATGSYKVSYGRTTSKLISRYGWAGTTVSKAPPTYYPQIVENRGMWRGATIGVTIGTTTTLKTVAPKASWGGSASGRLLFRYKGKWRGPLVRNDDFASVYVVDPTSRLSSRSHTLDSSGHWKVTGLAPGTYTVYGIAFYNGGLNGTGAQKAYPQKKLGTVRIRAGRNAVFKRLHY